jgi:hypothetical protein
MTSSPAPNSPPNKKKLFVYRGPQKECQNVIYELLQSPDNEGDEWQNGGEKMVYLHSIDRNIQPESVKSKFADYNLGSHDDLNYCEVDKDGVGGYLAMETEENFKKYYKQLGK